MDKLVRNGIAVFLVITLYLLGFGICFPALISSELPVSIIALSTVFLGVFVPIILFKIVQLLIAEKKKRKKWKQN